MCRCRWCDRRLRNRPARNPYGIFPTSDPMCSIVHPLRRLSQSSVHSIRYTRNAECLASGFRLREFVARHCKNSSRNASSAPKNRMVATRIARPRAIHTTGDGVRSELHDMPSGTRVAMRVLRWRVVHCRASRKLSKRHRRRLLRLADLRSGRIGLIGIRGVARVVGLARRRRVVASRALRWRHGSGNDVGRNLVHGCDLAMPAMLPMGDALQSPCQCRSADAIAQIAYRTSRPLIVSHAC